MKSIWTTYIFNYDDLLITGYERKLCPLYQSGITTAGSVA